MDFEGKRSYGPATTLRLYLNHVSWELQYDGTILGPEFQHCNILTDSTKSITRVFRRMWSSFIVQTMHRKGIDGQVINIDTTRRVFSKLSEEEQQLVKLNMVGGFQTEKRKSQWDEDNDGTCPFCQSDDTRPHRLLECAVFQHIRDQFPNVLRDLHNDRHNWIYLPLAIEPSMVTILQNFLEKVKTPLIPALFGGERDTLRFYTDGGAIHPRCPRARIASWAVVQDVSETPLQRQRQYATISAEQKQFPLFKTSAVGLVQGNQTVSRGELTALLVAVKIALKADGFPEVIFVTDASYVCKVLDMIGSGDFQKFLHKLPNSDIILELADLWDPNRFFIQKIKSHRDFSSARDWMDLWDILGNFCADQAATATLQSIPTTIRDLSQRIETAMSDEEKRLSECLMFLANFNQARTQSILAKKKEKKDHNRNLNVPRKPPERRIGHFDTEAMGPEAFELMFAFNPPGYRAIQVQQHENDIFQMCLQGAHLGKTFYHWAQLIMWPPDLDQHDKLDWGMSWLELIFNFYITTGYCMPIRKEGVGAKSIYVPYHGSEALLLPNSKRAASLQILTFRNLIQNMLSIQDQPVFPDFRECKCKSLQRFGHVCAVAGVPIRPVIPNQQQTLEAVQVYLHSLHGSAALHKPIFVREVVPTLQCDAFPEKSSKDRFNLYMQHMKKLRKQRRDN